MGVRSKSSGVGFSDPVNTKARISFISDLLGGNLSITFKVGLENMMALALIRTRPELTHYTSVVSDFCYHDILGKRKIFQRIRYWSYPIMAGKSQFWDYTVVHANLTFYTDIGTVFS
jgi:hypothetical protein